MDIKRRLAQSSDTKFARIAHHQAYYDVVVRQFGSWDENIQNAFFDKDWSNGVFEIILIDNVPGGYCRIDYFTQYIIVHELVILLEFQGKGIGTSILKEVIKDSNIKKIPIKIGALKENVALELYRRLGFEDIDFNDTHIGLQYDPN